MEWTERLVLQDLQESLGRKDLKESKECRGLTALWGQLALRAQTVLKVLMETQDQLDLWVLLQVPPLAVPTS